MYVSDEYYFSTDIFRSKFKIFIQRVPLKKFLGIETLNMLALTLEKLLKVRFDANEEKFGPLIT